MAAALTKIFVFLASVFYTLAVQSNQCPPVDKKMTAASCTTRWFTGIKNGSCPQLDNGNLVYNDFLVSSNNHSGLFFRYSWLEWSRSLLHGFATIIWKLSNEHEKATIQESTLGSTNSCMRPIPLLLKIRRWKIRKLCLLYARCLIELAGSLLRA